LAEVRKYMTEMIEDEFDFNQYCMRKMTLRSYIEFLNLEDRISSHKFFRSMCEIMVPLLMRVVRGEVKADEKWTEVAHTEAKAIVAELTKRAKGWSGTARMEQSIVV
jgi:N-alpha-acetyltransferase 15/16, NatA auxiliary subunit